MCYNEHGLGFLVVFSLNNLVSYLMTYQHSLKADTLPSLDVPNTILEENLQS